MRRLRRLRRSSQDCPWPRIWHTQQSCTASLLLWVKAMFTQMGSPQSTGRDRGCVCSASNDPSDTSIPKVLWELVQLECEVSAVLNFTPQIGTEHETWAAKASISRPQWLIQRQTHDSNPANEIHLEFCVETIGPKNFLLLLGLKLRKYKSS